MASAGCSNTSVLLCRCPSVARGWCLLYAPSNTPSSRGLAYTPTLPSSVPRCAVAGLLSSLEYAAANVVLLCAPSLPCMVPACRRLQLLVCLLRLARSIRLCWPALPSLTLGHQAALLLQHSCPVSGRSTFASHLPSMQLAAAHQPSSPACRSWLPSLLASALAGTTTLWMASATANSAACHTGGDAGSLSQAALCALALHEDLRNCAGNTAVYCVTSGALSPVAWHRQHPSKPVLQTAVLALLQAWNWRLAVCHDQVPQCPSCWH